MKSMLGGLRIECPVCCGKRDITLSLPKTSETVEMGCKRCYRRGFLLTPEGQKFAEFIGELKDKPWFFGEALTATEKEIGEATREPDGEWVEYDDYARLAKRLKAIEEALYALQSMMSEGKIDYRNS